MAPSALIAGSPLSIAELTAATLDGDLARVSRTAYASTALPDSVGLRASAAREFVPDGYAATWTTA
ncbi:MAG: SAM-dependent methyltransferase, partial [Microbacterium gubbeenense]